MANFFKKKKGESEQPGTSPEAGGSSVPGEPDSGKKLFGKKGPRPPKSSRMRTEKEPGRTKKPLFGGGKTGEEQTAAPAGGPEEEKQEKKKEKKPLFGKKGEKKVKPPREKKPKQKKPREKKSGEKKPLFGKKGGKKDEQPDAGEKQEKKPLFGKKGAGKKKKEKEKKKGRPAKARKGKRGGLGGSKMSPVGLDIGRSSITAARLKHQTGGSVLLQAALDTLPEGLIQEGEVADVEALSFAIRDFWKKYKIKGRKVALGLANQKVVVRALEFPVMNEKELQSAIEFQAQDYIPIPVEEAVFAHHVMGRFVDEEGVEMQKVLIVAAQKNMVMDFINAIKKAKLSVDGIDLQAFAMLRAMRPGGFLEEEKPREAIAIANIASDITNIVVDVGGEPQFTRIISFGGDDFTKAVQEHQGIKFEEAEILKIQAGLPESGAAPPPASEPEPGGREPFLEGEMGPEDLPFRHIGPEEGMEEAPGPGFGPPEEGPYPGPTAFGPPEGEPEGPVEGEAPVSEEERIAQVQRVLEVTSETLADELRRSLDYYMSQESAVPISMLLLSGGGSLLPNLHSHLSQVFAFEVRMGDPISRVTENKTDLTDEELRALAPRLAIAIGLALEDEGF